MLRRRVTVAALCLLLSGCSRQGGAAPFADAAAPPITPESESLAVAPTAPVPSGADVDSGTASERLDADVSAKPEAAAMALSPPSATSSAGIGAPAGSAARPVRGPGRARAIVKHVRERGVVEASVLAAELRRLGPELDPCFARFANEFVAPHSADFDVVVAAKGAVLSVRPSHGKRLEPLDQCMIPVLRTLRIPTPPRGGVVTVAFRSAGLTTHADRPRFGRGQVD